MSSSSPKKDVYGPERQSNRSLVLCFDGTGNKFHGTPEDSNILKIYSMLAHENVDQYSYYQPGIGTYVEHRSVNRASGHYARVKSWWAKQKDMMVGTSFAEHVVAGYKFLMTYYKKDDDIYMFGFSRGAYTARFLAEMLDYIGLLQAGNEELVRFAWKTFSNWQTRRDGNKDERKNQTEYKFMKGFRETFSRPIKPIRFLGLFDTVNSVPFFEVAFMQRTKYPYTARTSAKVIRHAVSIDERRSKFRQDLISDKSNAHERQHHFRQWAIDIRKAHERHEREKIETQYQYGMEERPHPSRPIPQSKESNHRFWKSPHGRMSIEDHKDPEEHQGSDDEPKDSGHFHHAYPNDEEVNDDDNQDIEEVWFSGGHGDIGGGWTINEGESPNPASHITLLWMIREAYRAGAPFDPAKLKAANFWPHDIKISSNATVDSMSKKFLTSINEAEASRTHDTLKFGDGLPFGGVLSWHVLELLPFRRMDLRDDGTWHPIRWPLPRGEPRDMPEKAVVHGSVMRRMKADSKYRPGNLIIGGGGRPPRIAPPAYGTGKWRVLKEEGDLLGECWLRDVSDKAIEESEKK